MDQQEKREPLSFLKTGQFFKTKLPNHGIVEKGFVTDEGLVTDETNQARDVANQRNNKPRKWHARDIPCKRQACKDQFSSYAE